MIETRERPDYSPAFIRFVAVPLHAEAYLAAYRAYDASSSSGELTRLYHERTHMLGRHSCMCYGGHCSGCARYQRSVQAMGSEVVIGRSSMVHPPTPMVLILDLQMAIDVLGRRRSTPERIARLLREGM